MGIGKAQLGVVRLVKRVEKQVSVYFSMLQPSRNKGAR